MNRFKYLLVALTAIMACRMAFAEQLMPYCLEIGDFEQLSVTDNLNVVYVSSADSAGRAVFHAPASTASMMMFKNNRGKLTVQLSPDAAGVSELPTVTVYSRFLSKAENSGDSTLRVLRLAPLPKLSFKLIGNGRLIVHDIATTKLEASLATGHGSIVLFGHCTEASLKFTGVGLIQADELEATEVSVRSFGTGSIGCYAVRTLKLSGMGSSTVYYKGNPEIINHSVGLKIKPME